VSEGGPADIQNSNTIEFFPSALALIIRAPSKVHMSLTEGTLSSKPAKRLDAARADIDNRGLQVVAGPNELKVQGGNGLANARANDKVAVAKAKKVEVDTELEPTKVWNDAFAKGGIEPGMVIATADFLFDTGYYEHAVEFLKADLRYGTVVRPWVYEALAVALEAVHGNPEEIRRARLSAVALDPQDAQGFLEAARAMAENKQFDRALAFCRQASQLEPNSAQPYADALVYAETAKDSRSMEWAVSKILSQDWATDSVGLHLKAQTRLETLSQTLKKENHTSEAERLKLALQQLRERDLVVNLSWDSGTEPADVNLTIKEPTGSVCSDVQTQTPGGGNFIGTDLLQMNHATYTAAQGYAGDYEVKVSRKWGQPLGSRARLEVIQHMGTPQESRRLISVPLDQPFSLKVTLANGRRTELAVAAPPSMEKKPEAPKSPTNALLKLRNLAHPYMSGVQQFETATSTPGASLATVSAKDRLAMPAYQSMVSAVRGTGVNYTAQVREPSELGGEASLVLHPVFQTTGARSNLKLPTIPGANP